ncbi:hypothetical protein HYW32_02555 [Candidatus Berkelbacteria bacterium]|nr:hypothetical protein [Candidatus Berkelbacteria bacterium]
MNNAKIYVILVVALVVGGAVLLFWQRNKLNSLQTESDTKIANLESENSRLKNQVAAPSQQTNPSQAETSETSDEIASGTAEESTSYLKYETEVSSDQEGKLEFSYPQDYTAQEPTPVRGDNRGIILIEKTALLSQHDDTDLPYPLRITIHPSLEDLVYDAGGAEDVSQIKSLADYLDRYSATEESRLQNITGISLGGQSAYKADAGPNVFGGDGAKIYLLEFDGWYYEIFESTPSPVTQDIIDSIKFSTN